LKLQLRKGLQQVKHAKAALGFLYRAMCSYNIPAEC
jgi:hypothetical protein